MSTNVELETFVENGVESFSMDLRLLLLLFVWQQVHLDIGVTSARHIHANQISRLHNAHCQLKSLMFNGWSSMVIAGKWFLNIYFPIFYCGSLLHIFHHSFPLKLPISTGVIAFSSRGSVEYRQIDTSLIRKRSDLLPRFCQSHFIHYFIR